MVDLLLIGLLKMITIVIGFFTLAGQEQVKKMWSYRLLTVFAILACTLIRLLPSLNQTMRLIMEVCIMFVYVACYCRKDLGHQCMYLLAVYVMLDVMAMFVGTVTYVMQGCSPGDNYEIWGNAALVVNYVLLILLFLWMRKWPRRIPRKKGFSIAEAGITIILLFAEGAIWGFIMEEESNESTVFYFFSFVFALIICLLWAWDKMESERKAREFAAYEHRMREVLPTVGKALERMGDLSADSNEVAKIMEELREICRADEKTTQAEIFAAKTFVSTKSAVLDVMLERYLQEAVQKALNVDVIVRAPVDSLLKEQKIEIKLFLQMFGDIYRNAEKAVSKLAEGGRILVCMGYNREAEYEISVSDNGEAFLPQVLEHLGERGVTTDGTGNGLADVLAVAEKYKISFLLEQDMGQKQIFTKTLRLVFDGKGRRELPEIGNIAGSVAK